jgi:hypothetical protein
MDSENIGDHQFLSANPVDFFGPIPNLNHLGAFPSSRGNVSNTFNSVGGDMTHLNVTSYGESGG